MHFFRTSPIALSGILRKMRLSDRVTKILRGLWRFLLCSIVLLISVYVVALAMLSNIPETWNDYMMVRSLSDEPVTTLILAIEKYEDENGAPPESLLDLHPDYISNKPVLIVPNSKNIWRYFRYTRYPKGDGEEVELIYNKSSDRERVSVTCNEFGKCAGHNTHIDAALEKYGAPDIRKTTYKRDWEIAAVFPTEHNLSSGDSYEYMYWRTGDYPEGYASSSTVEGWGAVSWLRDNTKFGVGQFFRIKGVDD